jgi:hypothetical protein
MIISSPIFGVAYIAKPPNADTPNLKILNLAFESGSSEISRCSQHCIEFLDNNYDLHNILPYTGQSGEGHLTEPGRAKPEGSAPATILPKKKRKGTTSSNCKFSELFTSRP